MTEASPVLSRPFASDEQELVRRIAAGDHDAFELLMRRYNRRLYRVARVTIGNDAEAEDVLQEAYLLAYRRIGQFRGDASLFTWLSRLVLNECFGRMRKEARRRKVIPMRGNGCWPRSIRPTTTPCGWRHEKHWLTVTGRRSSRLHERRKWRNIHSVFFSS